LPAPAPSPVRPPAARSSGTAALASVVLALVAAVVFDRARPEGRLRPFEIDEAEWITMAVHNWRQVLGEVSPFEKLPPSERDVPEANRWKVGIHQSTFGYMNPLLPKLVLGAVAAAGGHRDFDPAIYPRFTKDLPPARQEAAKKRARAAAAPARGALRNTILVLASVSAAALALAAARAAGWAAGLAAFALFLSAPRIRVSATWIRTDFFPIALALVALVAALALADWLAGTRGRGRLVAASAVLGTLAGLSVGSKLNGALLALLVGAWIALAWLTAPRGARPGFARGPLVGWLVSGVLCVALYVLFSPHLWPAPVENLHKLLDAWASDIAHQQQRYGDRIGAASTLAEHWRLAFHGRHGVLEAEEPFFALTGVALGGALMLGGLAALGLRTVASGRAARGVDGGDASARRVARGALFALVWAVVTIGGTALWLPLGRDNFYVAFWAPVCLLEGALVGSLVMLPWKLARRPAAAGSP